MSASGNLDLVRPIYAAWERGDFSSVAWADPEIEFVRPDGPETGSWRLGDVAQGWGAVLSAWEGFRIKAQEYRELDHERVLVLTTYTGRGRTSGIELGTVQAKGASLLHIRDGKVTRHVFYWDRERALSELGLSSDAAGASEAADDREG